MYGVFLNAYFTDQVNETTTSGTHLDQSLRVCNAAVNVQAQNVKNGAVSDSPDANHTKTVEELKICTLSKFKLRTTFGV